MKEGIDFSLCCEIALGAEVLGKIYRGKPKDGFYYQLIPLLRESYQLALAVMDYCDDPIATPEANVYKAAEALNLSVLTVREILRLLPEYQHE